MLFIVVSVFADPLYQNFADEYKISHKCCNAVAGGLLRTRGWESMSGDQCIRDSCALEDE